MELFTHRSGNPGGPRMLLLHGFTEDGTTWPDLVERWHGAWDLVGVDLRGHGRSPRFAPDEVARASEVMLDDVIELLAQQPEPVVLLGHSLGGNLALRAACRLPDRVRALVLEDPSSPFGPDDDVSGFVTGTLEFLDSFADRDGEIARMRRATTWSLAEIDAWADSKPRVDRSAVGRGIGAGGDWPALWRDVAVPTLLVVPPGPTMAPLDHGNPRVSRVVVPGAGHCVRRDRPEEFFTAVEEFLGAH